MRARCSSLAATHLLRPGSPFVRPFFVSAAGDATGKEGSPGDRTRPQPSRISSISDCRGLPLDAAVAAVERLDVSSKSNMRKITYDPCSIVELFLSHGLTRPQIEKLVAMYPAILLVDSKRTLKPKLDFLSGELGLSGEDLAKIVTSNTIILRSSLEKRIRPTLALLSSILGSKEHIITVLKRSPFLISFSAERWISPKLETLRGLGVSDLAISKLTRISPAALTQSTKRFNQVIERLRELGFSPTKTSFVVGIHAVSCLGLANLKRKLALYRSFGLSEDEVLFAFRRNPIIATLSDQNIRNHMDFFLNNLKWKPQVVLSNPALMGISLERRLIPRAVVRSVLLSKGLLRSKKSNFYILIVREDIFLEKYVARFQNDCPGLLDTYQKAKERALTDRS